MEAERKKDREGGRICLRWQKRKPIRHWDDSKFRRTIKNTTQCACVVWLLYMCTSKGAHLYHFVSGDKLLWFVNSFFFVVIQRFLFFLYFLNECKTHRYFEWDSCSFLFVAFVHSSKKFKNRKILSNESFTHQINLLNSVYVRRYVHTERKSMNWWWCSPMFAFCRT